MDFIENNIASDIRLSRNVVNKESKRSRRFVCYCDTSSGDKNYCKQGSFILYGRTGGAVYNSIDNWNNNAQCLLVDAHGDRPITKAAGSAAGSADAPGLLADAIRYSTKSTGRWLGPSAEWNRPLLAGRTASVMAAYRPHPKFGDIDPVGLC